MVRRISTKNKHRLLYDCFWFPKFSQNLARSSISLLPQPKKSIMTSTSALVQQTKFIQINCSPPAHDQGTLLRVWELSPLSGPASDQQSTFVALHSGPPTNSPRKTTSLFELNERATRSSLSNLFELNERATRSSLSNLFELNERATRSSLSNLLGVDDAGAALLIMGNASMGADEFRAYTQNSMMATLLGVGVLVVDGGGILNS